MYDKLCEKLTFNSVVLDSGDEVYGCRVGENAVTFNSVVLDSTLLGSGALVRKSE